jgi:hypothetical protein
MMNLSQENQQNVRLNQILRYQEKMRESLGRYISFSEAIAMWISEKQKDTSSLNFDSENYH